MNIYNQKIDFRKTKPQKYDDPWERRRRKIIFLGVCPTCGVNMLGFDDEHYPDPRGVIGRHTASYLDPEEHGMKGDTLKVCFDCLNTRETYETALRMAKKGWIKK